MHWGRAWFVNFNVAKTQLILLDWSNNTGVIYVKIVVSALKERTSFRCWGGLFLLNYIEALISLSLSRKFGP